MQRSGPYLLGGRCYGGRVAFEMARQLAAADEEVALLALLKAPADLLSRRREAPGAAERGKHQGGARRPAAGGRRPGAAAAWYENIRSVEWRSARPVAIGSRVTFVARFLGRRLTYTYEVTEMLAGERFVMSTAEGPFPMETTYTWQDSPSAGTRMSLRNRGEPSGFPRLAAPLMAKAMRRANRKDLERLKSLLEAG